MAQTAKPDVSGVKRVGDYNPDQEVGEVLDAIANIDVILYSVSFDKRTGRKGPYVLAIVEAGEPGGDRNDAGLYHTGGSVVVERLAAIFGVPSIESLIAEFLDQGRQPDTANLPVLATFRKERSQSNPGQSYWTVS